MYTPLVASQACCRKTASPLSLHTSMGMCSRWQAKILFITGMYWCAESLDPLTETIRIRLWSRSSSFEAEYRPGPVPAAPAPAPAPPLPPSPAASSKSAPPCSSAQAMVRRLMLLSANVRAPASMVEVLPRRSLLLVESMSSFSCFVTCSSTKRNGRYLFVCGAAAPSPFIETSPSGSADSCEVSSLWTGYSHVAFVVWEATTATSLA